MTTTNYLIFLLIFFVTSTNVYAAQCSDKAYREFDFWLGHWQVTTKNDNVVRYNKISSINGGCTLLEEYSTPSGYQGKSFNIYDKQSQQWHQTWTDNSGLLLLLNGKRVGNQMILMGHTINKGDKINNRITWTKNADGTVRQHWQSMGSQENSWKTLFDGLYTKMPIKRDLNVKAKKPAK